MKFKSHPLLLSLLSWLCFPVYVVQGLWVRANSMRLSPPQTGPHEGQFGKGNPVRNILTVGDSSAAGVGIENMTGTIGYQIAKKIHAQDGLTTAWRVSGHNSAVAGEIRDIVVPNLEPENFTHIYLMIGMNDSKNWHSVGRWKREFGGLIYALRTRYPNAKIYWHQAIDLTQVPALPKPLSVILNWRASLFNRKGAQLCLERGVVCIPPLPVTTFEGYCHDGFHANEIGYDAWSDHMLQFEQLMPTQSPAVQQFKT